MENSSSQGEREDSDSSDKEYLLRLKVREQVFKDREQLRKEYLLRLKVREQVFKETKLFFKEWNDLSDEETEQRLKETEQRLKVLADIRSLGPKATLAYQNALEAGRVEVYRAQVMLVGQDRAGKTSLKKSLLGLPFDPDEQSTDGIEVDPSSFEIVVEQVQNWQRIDEESGISLFGNDLLKIMAEKLNAEITNRNRYVRGKPQEKTSEQDKINLPQS